MMDYTETLCAAIAIFGTEMQQIVAMEELGELIQEVSKQLRGKGDPEHLAEEIADVKIMLDQLVLMHNLFRKVDEYREAKTSRLLESILAKGRGGV